jgi:hypothetical protein
VASHALIDLIWLGWPGATSRETWLAVATGLFTLQSSAARIPDQHTAPGAFPSSCNVTPYLEAAVKHLCTIGVHFRLLYTRALQQVKLFIYVWPLEDRDDGKSQALAVVSSTASTLAPL